jgi:hypothetical protein
MSHRVSIMLLIVSLFWIDFAAAQRASREAPSWRLSVSEGRVTATIRRTKLGVILDELARHTSVTLSVQASWREHPVTADFAELSLDEAIARLLAGFSYAIIYDSASATQPGADPAHRKGELIVFDQPAGLGAADSPVALAATPDSIMAAAHGQALAPKTPSDWNAAFQHSDTVMRIESLHRSAEKGAATQLDPLLETTERDLG